MPKYSYSCKCGFNAQKLVKNRHTEVLCDQCGRTMTRKLPILSGPPEVREKYGELNKTVKKDQDKLIRDRKSLYYWKHEVPKLVSSGVYSLETMLENQWVYYDEKGDLRTRTSPPSKG